MPVDPWGFLTNRREDAARRPVDDRLADWHVVLEPADDDVVRRNAVRCMDCGIAFCESACPSGNRIPQWNELINNDAWRAASEQLHATNNFPEITGSLCPAPCEASCVLAINDDPVAVRQVELAIVERAFEEGWVIPRLPTRSTGRSIAIVGSGPAGLAAAQQLTRAGHHVSVFERNDRIGGLLRYGIPDFKMDKTLIDRRLDQLQVEGTEFYTDIDIGRDVTADELERSVDAVIIACGAGRARGLDVPGADLGGIHDGMDYLVGANRVQTGDLPRPPIDAAGRHVAIIGGGDTGLDCLGTANRQGAASVRLVDHNPSPPVSRDTVVNPWPQWPRVHKRGFAHEEGVGEDWQAEVRELAGDSAGRVSTIHGDVVNAVFVDGDRHFESVAGDAAFEMESDLVLLATGFDGVDRSALITDLDVELTSAGTIAVDGEWCSTTAGVYACGDATRGASLVAWAIADGRSCAAAVHHALTGDDSLPRPVSPTDGPL